MALLKKAQNQTAFLKAGIMGFQGSGKTFTAVEMAIGLTKLSQGTKVAFYDTETGSDFHIKKFEEHGIQLDVAKTRSFKDLCDTVRESESGGYSVLLIDSISHVWREIMQAYIKRLGRRNGLYMQDWGVLKLEWQSFTDLYLNSKLHIVMCGRAGYEYTQDINSETGKKEMIKTGTKMKVEGEMGYEPSLLLEMESIRKSEIEGDKDIKGFVNRCYVLKDRTDRMNGKQIDFPKFKDFKPVMDFLNIGGEHLGVDTTRNSEDMFENPDYSYAHRQKQKEIALEELQATLIKLGLDGTSTEAKKNRVALLESIFGTSSKTAIENLNLDQVLIGVNAVKQKLNPSADLGDEKL